MNTEKSKQFVLQTARPLEQATYRFFFENGEKDGVLQKLKAFQNPDGGFGHGLELDNWNPNSNPIATNDALIILHRIGALDGENEILQGILRYLYSHDSFDEQQRRWLFAIDSNRDYPHGFWWEKEGDGIHGFNPTVSLAAVCLCFGEDDGYYREIVREGFFYLAENPDVSGDALKCFLLAHTLLENKGISDVIDLDNTQKLLCQRLENAICKDTALYGVEYVPVPSDFFVGTYGEYITPPIRHLIDAERAVLGKLQMRDGGFDISWQWGTDYEEFHQARRWWQARITIDKLLFLQQTERKTK